MTAADAAMGAAMPEARHYNVHEAKTQLSKILEEVESGEEVIIDRAGTPVAKVVPAHKKTPLRTPGLLRGQIWISDDFDDEDPDINAMFGME